MGPRCDRDTGWKLSTRIYSVPMSYREYKTCVTGLRARQFIVVWYSCAKLLKLVDWLFVWARRYNRGFILHSEEWNYELKLNQDRPAKVLKFELFLCRTVFWCVVRRFEQKQTRVDKLLWTIYYVKQKVSWLCVCVCAFVRISFCKAPASVDYI